MFKNEYTLSKQQKAIWLSQSLYKESSMFNIGGYAHLKGKFDSSILQKSIKQILINTDVLVKGSVLDNIEKRDKGNGANYFFDEIDFSSDPNSEELSLNWMSTDINHSFNLSDDLLKIVILKVSNDNHFWYVKIHHVLFDGFSMALFFNKVTEQYLKLEKGVDEIIELGECKYSNYIKDEITYLSSCEYKKDKDFWLGRLGELDYSRAFESCFKANRTQSLSSKRKKIIVTRDRFTQIEIFCKEHGVKPFHYFIGIIFTLNKKYNNDSFILGIPIFNRRNKQFKNTLGTFVNIIPFSIEFNLDISFVSLLKKIKEELNSCYRHKRFSLIDILHELDIKGNIYDSTFSYQKNTYNNKFCDADVNITYLANCEQESDLSCHLLEYSESEDLIFCIDYKEELFDGIVIERILDHLELLCETMLSAPEFSLRDIDFLNEEEKNEILVSFNDTKVDYPKEKTIVELFEEQVERTPDNVAIVFDDKKYTYKELNEISNQLAHCLRDNYNIGREDLIGIHLDKSDWLIVSILGVLKTGAAYVPIDSEEPTARKKHVIEDCQIKLLITDRNYLIDFEGYDGDLFAIDIEFEPFEYSSIALGIEIDFNNLAYVIYTSGTTGTAKGVMVENQNVVSLVKPGLFFPLTGNSVLLSTGSVSFDATIIEFFGTLLNGSTLILENQKDLLEPKKLMSSIRQNGVNCMWMTSSWFNYVVDNGLEVFDGIKQLIIGGDVVSPYHVKNLLAKYPEIKLTNGYGPTENTTFSTTFEIKNQEYQRVPIGKPISNSQVYILGENLQVLPKGAEGMLYVGGTGLARGYLNNPELTAEKFITNPFREGERMYKTGDLAKWLEDGTIDFLGRNDDQVKIRGYRIELGEIENVLLQNTRIEQTIVLAKEYTNADKILVAYIVSTEELNTKELRSFLDKFLPDYMIPSYFVQLEELPLTANGKIDKRALPSPEEISIDTCVEYVAPRNEMEEKLVNIWKNIFQKEKIGIRDDFFELGGHSLKASELTGLIYKKCGIQIRLSDVFSYPTIEDLSKIIVNYNIEGYQEIEVLSKQDYYDLSFSQLGMWFVAQKYGNSNSYNLPGQILFNKDVDIDGVILAVSTVIRRHESLRTTINQIDGTPKQVIHDFENIDDYFQVVNIENDKNQGKKKNEIIIAEVAKIFDLEKGPLLRAKLIITSDNAVLSFVFHHIIADGWSFEILKREINQIHHSIRVGRKIQFEPLKVQFKDFASWQNKLIENGKFDSSKEYWRTKLGGELPVLDLPYDYDSTSSTQNIGASFDTVILPELYLKLKDLSKSQNIGLFSILKGCFHILISKMTSQTDVITGAPSGIRGHADLSNVFGDFLNTLMIRSEVEQKSSVLNYLKTINKSIIEAIDHQYYPFEKVLEDLSITGSPKSFPVSPVFINLLNFIESEWNETVDDSAKHKEFSVQQKFHINTFFTEYKNCIQLSCIYRRDLFLPSTIEYIIEEYILLISAICDNPLNAIEDYRIFDADKFSEKKVKSLVNVAYNEFIKEDISLIDRFKEQVRLRPEKHAVKSVKKNLTYMELDECSSNISRIVISHLSEDKTPHISLLFEQDCMSIVGMLGVLKSGCAYVPLDPTYPFDRLIYMLSDSNSQMIITNDENYYLASTLIENIDRNVIVINIDEINRKDISIQDEKELKLPIGNLTDVAYILYTSGSTGKPKGVIQKKENLLHFIRVYTNNLHLNKSDKLSLLSTYSFDASVMDIYGALLNGASVHIYDLKSVTGFHGLGAWLQRESITVYHSTPTVFRSFIGEMEEPVDLSNIRLVVLGGEATNKTDVERYKKHFSKSSVFVNGLGPTESTVTLQNFINMESEIRKSNIPVGNAVTDTSIYLIKDNGQLANVFEQGELTFSSDYLALGYLNNPELTSEKFVKNPFKPNSLMYKSGDLAKRLPDGTIEFVGRMDDQVKIRGYRIELGEIQSVLQKHDSIEDSIVLIKEDQAGDKILVAYLVVRGELVLNMMRNYLKELLPDYMLPSIFMKIDELPLTPNGKIDKSKLPEPSSMVEISKAEYASPRNEIEEKLVEIWSEVLGIEKEIIGVNDNFFDLGGTSLKIIAMMKLINKSFSVEEGITIVFRLPTINDQANYFQDRQNSGSSSDNYADESVQAFDDTINLLNSIDE